MMRRWQRLADGVRDGVERSVQLGLPGSRQLGPGGDEAFAGRHERAQDGPPGGEEADRRPDVDGAMGDPHGDRPEDHREGQGEGERVEADRQGHGRDGAAVQRRGRSLWHSELLGWRTPSVSWLARAVTTPELRGVPPTLRPYRQSTVRQ
jgi:hypothetical protein